MLDENELQVQIDGAQNLPILIYLPGIHGDWSLLSGFRALAKDKVRLVQFTYPRTLSWSLADYAHFVDIELRKLGISDGWVLAESFSSQVAWAWLQLAQQRRTDFRFNGVIMAGGFVRYPVAPALVCARVFFALAPWWLWRLLFWAYLRYSGFRHRNAGPVGNCAADFIERRTPSDIAAIRARLRLIYTADPREVVKRVECPVFQLSGTIDPVVPPWFVRAWLRRNCPVFKGHRILWPADHNVLGTEPAQALQQIEHWMRLPLNE